MRPARAESRAQMQTPLASARALPPRQDIVAPVRKRSQTTAARSRASGSSDGLTGSAASHAQTAGPESGSPLAALRAPLSQHREPLQASGRNRARTMSSP